MQRAIHNPGIRRGPNDIHTRESREPLEHQGGESYLARGMLVENVMNF